MFGEYVIYCDGKVVALVCDNQLFVKPTKVGLGKLGIILQAAPYPGAKPHLLIGEELDDPETISNIIRLTATELSAPRPKKLKFTGGKT